jgi:hypothetical protein
LWRVLVWTWTISTPLFAGPLRPSRRVTDRLTSPGVAGLLLESYYDDDSPTLLAPLALELKPEQITPYVERDGYQEELGNPAIDEFPHAWAALPRTEQSHRVGV